jgi:hypothetical protein
VGRSWWVGGVHGVIARVPWDGAVDVVRPPTRLWSKSAVVSVGPDGRTWARSTLDEVELLVDGDVVARTRVPLGTTVVDHVFDPSGRRLIVMHWGTTIYAVPGLEVVAHLERHRAAAVSPDERLLARGHADGHVQLFDYATLRPIGPPILVGYGAIDNLAFTGDGAALYAGSNHGTVARVATDPAAWLRLACELAWGGLGPRDVATVVGDPSLVSDCRTY